MLHILTFLSLTICLGGITPLHTLPLFYTTNVRYRKHTHTHTINHIQVWSSMEFQAEAISGYIKQANYCIALLAMTTLA